MRKLFMVSFAICLSTVMVGKTQVKILEDNTIIQQENDVMVVSVNQKFSGVPSIPCVKGFIEKRERSENPTWKEKIKNFFYDVYDNLSWKRVAYGLGGVVVAGSAYKLGKKAHKEHYGHNAHAKLSTWWHKK